MRTLGIDLATSNGSTGICEVDWRHRTATVEVGRFEDEVITARIREVRGEGGWTSIDAPFGFPAAFNRSVQNWQTAGTVPVESDHDLRRRVTDGYIAKRQAEIKAEGMPGRWNTWPLSPVVDLITPTVIRCARILAAVHDGAPIDRIGLTSRVVEAYPISVLRAWAIATNNYKNVAAHCDLIFEKLSELTAVPRPALVGRPAKGCDDDAVDALVCALLARVVALADGATGPAAAGDTYASQLDTVREEGWIHLPPPHHRLRPLAAP